MRRRGETDLVVHHDMHGAAGFVTFQARERKTLCHNTLTGKGRIAVQQDRQNLAARAVVFLILLGADLAQNHRVHRLKVAWIGGQRHGERD